MSAGGPGRPRRPAPVDVCVVGSGAGGLPVATRLAQKGLRVVVLERGPWLRRADFLEDELLMRRGLFWPTVEEEPRTWRPDESQEAVRLPTAVQLFANAMVVTLAMALIVLRIGISPGACCAQCEEGTKNGIDYAKVATEYIGSGTILYCNNTA